MEWFVLVFFLFMVMLFVWPIFWPEDEDEDE